jgi:hypothetical protein
MFFSEAIIIKSKIKTAAASWIRRKTATSLSLLLILSFVAFSFLLSFFRINQSIRKYRYLFPIKCIKDTNDIELQLLSICLYIHPTYQNSHIENTEITTTTFPVLHNPKNKRKNEYRKKNKKFRQIMMDWIGLVRRR